MGEHVTIPDPDVLLGAAVTRTCALTPCEGGLCIEGDLDLQTISQALDAFERMTMQTTPTFLDLAGVASCDSSALAFLLHASRRGVGEWRHVPANLQAIARACQLESLFADQSHATTALNTM